MKARHPSYYYDIFQKVWCIGIKTTFMLDEIEGEHIS